MSLSHQRQGMQIYSSISRSPDKICLITCPQEQDFKRSCCPNIGNIFAVWSALHITVQMWKLLLKVQRPYANWTSNLKHLIDISILIYMKKLIGFADVVICQNCFVGHVYYFHKSRMSGINLDIKTNNLSQFRKKHKCFLSHISAAIQFKKFGKENRIEDFFMNARIHHTREVNNLIEG